MADVSKLRANINGVFEIFGIKDATAREDVDKLKSAIADLKNSINDLGLSVVDGAINITYQEVSE